MKLHYYPDTDTLYIELSDRPSVDSDEIADDVVVDYAEDGRPLGFEIEHAATFLDLTTLEAHSLPIAG